MSHLPFFPVARVAVLLHLRILYSPEALLYSPCDKFSSVSFSSASVSDDIDDHSDIEQPSQQFISDQPTPEQPPPEDTFFSFKIVVKTSTKMSNRLTKELK